MDVFENECGVKKAAVEVIPLVECLSGNGYEVMSQ